MRQEAERRQNVVGRGVYKSRGHFGAKGWRGDVESASLTTVRPQISSVLQDPFNRARSESPPHNPKVVGSNPTRATDRRIPRNLVGPSRVTLGRSLVQKSDCRASVHRAAAQDVPERGRSYRRSTGAGVVAGAIENGHARRGPSAASARDGGCLPRRCTRGEAPLGSRRHLWRRVRSPENMDPYRRRRGIGDRRIDASGFFRNRFINRGNGSPSTR